MCSSAMVVCSLVQNRSLLIASFLPFLVPCLCNTLLFFCSAVDGFSRHFKGIGETWHRLVHLAGFSSSAFSFAFPGLDVWRTRRCPTSTFSRFALPTSFAATQVYRQNACCTHFCPQKRLPEPRRERPTYYLPTDYIYLPFGQGNLLRSLPQKLTQQSDPSPSTVISNISTT